MHHTAHESLWKILVNICQKFGVMHDLTRRFIFFVHCTFAFRCVGSCMARDLKGRCKLCSQCTICVTWSQRLRRLARVPETLQKLLAAGHQSDASAHWGVGLAAGRSLCAVSVGLHCSFVDSMARQRASRGERVAETSQLGDSRGACPNFLGGWQCIAYDLDFCMHVSACFCVGTASWLTFEVFCSHVLFACFAF